MSRNTPFIPISCYNSPYTNIEGLADQHDNSDEVGRPSVLDAIDVGQLVSNPNQA